MLPLISMESSPETLLELCFKYIVHHLETICTYDPFTKDYNLKDGLTLPSEICESIFHAYQQTGHELDDHFVNIFKNPNTTRLKRVRLRNSSITDEGLTTILKHNIVELDLANCNNLTETSLTLINDYGDNLISLLIGSSVPILPVYFFRTINVEGSKYLSRGYILKAPNLRRLAVRHLMVQSDDIKYFEVLLQPLIHLTHLDLSGCIGLGDFEFLNNLEKLTSLVLYNAQNLQQAITTICKLKNLRHLDISQSTDKHGTFKNENETLALLVESLPHLTSLDISGTNLAGTGVAETKSLKQVASDIPGLASRVHTPLEFLGLYGTPHGACRRHDIPAKLISGEANEAQILTAATAYIERPQVLQKVLNDLYHLFRYETCQRTGHALTIVLEAMDRHVTEKHIQISGSATLFYIVKGKDKFTSGTKSKRRVISTLLNGMSLHLDDDIMMRNGCLTLCQFKIPEDVLFDYKRLVQILLHIVYEMDQEGFVQRIGIYLLNSLACQVDGFQKQLLGDLGAIQRMLALIEDRLARKVCDDVLEVAWSTMWNVTDETPINCQRFLEGRGMEFFLQCLNTFPEKDELLRNMMGLLGNVAEVQTLRPRLMTHQFVTVFADLLDSSSDGIEVSYNAAGVLSHMASDGPLLWTLTTPRREDVLNRMVQAIERWDLATERNINYRSFEPILYLANVYHTPECQHWAIWALANLTYVYPSKYCLLVEAEGGMAILDKILSHELPYPRIKELARMVKTNCQMYHEQNRRSTLTLYDG